MFLKPMCVSNSIKVDIKNSLNCIKSPHHIDDFIDKIKINKINNDINDNNNYHKNSSINNNQSHKNNAALTILHQLIKTEQNNGL